MAPTTYQVYRCSPCDTEWPYHANFKVCPVCGTKTWRTATYDPPLSKTKAEEFAAEVKAAVADEPQAMYTPRQLYRIVTEARETLRALPTASRWDIPLEERCAEYDPDSGWTQT